jgi:hypothetical protein
MPGKKSAPATVTVEETPKSLVIDNEDLDVMEETAKPTYSSKTLNEFLPDYTGKLPDTASYIEVFLFIDKTRIKQTEKCSLFTFTPARINIFDKSRKALGGMSTAKLQSIYGDEFQLTI